MSKSIIPASATRLPSRRMFLATGSAAAMLAPERCTADETKSVDAELIALGHELKLAMAVEAEAIASTPDGFGDDDYWNAIILPAGELVARIEAMTAHTLEGLQTKAIAVLSCHSGEFDGIGGDATDSRLATGIIRDLLAISARVEA